MSNIRWKCAFYAAVFGFALIFLDIRTGAAFEGSAMGYTDLQRTEKPNGTTGVSLQAYPHIVQLSDPMVPHEGHGVISRRKRNILFPSGVKLCSQESAPQVAANHLNYFHLRVCQETVWEAFKIFWDRLPEQEEYQHWMSQCQDGAVKVHDIGNYFSQSQEHQALIDTRMALQALKSTGSEPPTSFEQPMCSTPSPEDPEEAEAFEEATAEAVSDAGEEADTAAEVEAAAAVPEVEVVPVVIDASSVDNDIAMEPPTPPVLEQVVELSILLTGERYSEQLRDPTSLQYQTLDRQLTEKIDDALEGLPGFKNVAVLDFRPQKDSQRLDGVVVDYAVTMLVDGGGVSAEQLDYLTLQSNRVENSYREVQERPTVVYTVSEVRNYVTEALHNDALESEINTPTRPVVGAPEFRETVHSINEATGSNTLPDETAEVLEVEASDVTMDEPLSEMSEVEVVAAGVNDVIVLEESATEAPAPVLTTAAPQSDSIEEESLMLEETVQSPVAEELPAEPTSPVQPGDTAPPEPSPAIEASGSVPEELEDLPLTITTEDDEPDAEEDVILEQDYIEEEVIAEPAVEVEPVPMEEAGEVVVDVDEVPAELETETETTGEEDTDEVVEQLEGAVLAYPQPSEHEEEEDVVEEAIEKEEEAMKEDVALDSLVVEEQAPEAPGISTEDLTEDEIFLVDGIVPAPVATDFPGSAKPTVLSPERESPFTRVSDIVPAGYGPPVMEVSIAVEVQTPEVDLADVTEGDLGYDVIHYGFGLTNHTEEGSSGFPAGVVHGTDQASIALPVNPGRALMVFFSLRVTNMMFSDDLFNKSSAEYKALEQRFIELLVPYLQSNLSNFQNLEILNFRNGSIVVNSRMKFDKPVPRGVNTAVYLILEDFCNTAYQTMNLAIDKYSLDVESGDQADPCKFQACNEYAKCKPNRWTGEAECVCNAGYFSVEGLPCQSICELKTDFCQNDGKCDIIPGQGAICRCRVGENWWYRGEHCEEYVSEPLVVGIAIASVAGFLLVASGVIFFLARTLRDQYEKDEAEDPIRRAESLPSLERATKYNPMYESEATTGYSHYYRRYPEAPVYSSASAEASTDFSSEEIRHIYENSELTKEEIQDRIRIVELYAKDRQFADFVRQHQAVLDTRNESSSTAQT